MSVSESPDKLGKESRILERYASAVPEVNHLH
jgi:hypothetical protein